MALLDTGSTVSTICQGMYDQHFSNIPIKSVQEMLNIEGANGQSLPYSGYIEVSLNIPKVKEPLPCLLLVVPDTRYGQNVPVVLGTNVLSTIMDILQQEYGVRYQQTANLGDSWHLAFRCINLQNKKTEKSRGMLSIVKSAETFKLVIPSNSTVTLKGKLDKMIQHRACSAITQPSSHLFCLWMWKSPQPWYVMIKISRLYP